MDKRAGVPDPVRSTSACSSLPVIHCRNSQAAFLFLAGAVGGMPIPSINVAQLWTFGPAGTGANPTLSTTLDLVASSSGAENPIPSHHIAARPCMKVVWHSFQLNPIFPGGPHSFMIFWYQEAASIAAGVSVSSFLPSADTVS